VFCNPKPWMCRPEPDRQSKLCANCQSHLTTVVLTETEKLLGHMQNILHEPKPNCISSQPLHHSMANHHSTCPALTPHATRHVGSIYSLKTQTQITQTSLRSRLGLGGVTEELETENNEVSPF